MEVGQTTQAIQVTAQAASLETQSPTVGSLVGEKMIQDMPVLSRSLFDLLPITMVLALPGKAVATRIEAQSRRHQFLYRWGSRY